MAVSAPFPGPERHGFHLAFRCPFWGKKHVPEPKHQLGSQRLENLEETQLNATGPSHKAWTWACISGGPTRHRPLPTPGPGVGSTSAGSCLIQPKGGSIGT